MLKSLGLIKKNFKLRSTSCCIDNAVFQLHYRLTALMFLVATVLVTSREYIGEHIRCINDEGVENKVMNTYCFFTTTFTVVKHMDPKRLDEGYLAHPGVGPYGLNSRDEVTHHAYYQWVVYLLILQAFLFYVPHIIWKRLEGGRMKNIIDGLDQAAFTLIDKEITIQDNKIPTKTAVDEKLSIIRRMFIDRFHLDNFWTVKLIGCEILNLLNVIFQAYFLNEFLGGAFYNLGYNVMYEGLDSSVDVLDRVFPKVTKCSFRKYGPSGTIQLHDALCVMALNIINEKIYMFFWFWFLFLFIVSSMVLLWRLVSLFLHSRSKKFNEMVFGTVCPGGLNPWTVLKVTKLCHYSDWLFLRYLAKNLDGIVFRELCIGLAEDLEDRKPLLDLHEDNDSGSFSKDEKPHLV